VEPQPGFETARVLFAYADGRLAVWDLHAKKPAATFRPTPETKTANENVSRIMCATWVGNGGGVIATGHDDGAVRLWIVPALGKPGSARRHAVAIACARAFHPRAGASADERMPVRALAARAVGAAGSSMAGHAHAGHRGSGSSGDDRGDGGESRSAGVLACVGGEAAGAPDPAVLVPLELDAASGPPRPAEARKAGAVALPYFGPVTAVALASPPFRPETAAAAATLSEGGQIHVHDARALADGALFRRRDPPAVSPALPSAEEASDGASTDPETSASTSREPQKPLPAEEIVELMPRLAARCAPAATAASPGFIRRFAGALDAAGPDAFKSRREAWGDAWPLTWRRGGRRRPVVQGERRRAEERRRRRRRRGRGGARLRGGRRSIRPRSARVARPQRRHVREGPRRDHLPPRVRRLDAGRRAPVRRRGGALRARRPSPGVRRAHAGRRFGFKTSGWNRA
jgi:hypothetical protein